MTAEQVTTFDVLVEIPKGSRNKYEMDHKTGEIFLNRMLFTATRYPADYGFFPNTLADDGDPLDALALVSEPTFPGCRIRIRPIGLFLMEDQGQADHKVLCVPLGDPVWAGAASLDDVPTHLLKEFGAPFQCLQGSRGEEDPPSGGDRRRRPQPSSQQLAPPFEGEEAIGCR